MKNLVIVAVCFLIVTGWVVEAWAHGPGGFRSGTWSDGYSKPGFFRPSSKNPGSGWHNFYRHPRSFQGTGYGHGRPHHGRLYGPHRQRIPQDRRFPRIESGVLLNKPGPLQNRTFYSPLVQSYNRGFGVSPLRKALERKEGRRLRAICIPRISITMKILTPGFFMARATSSAGWAFFPLNADLALNAPTRNRK